MRVSLQLFAAALLLTGSLAAEEGPRRNTSASNPDVFRLIPNYVKPVESSGGHADLNRNRHSHTSTAAHLGRVDVISELGLTDAQQVQIASLFAVHVKEVTDLAADPRTMAGDEFLERLDDLSSRRDAQLLKVLNEPQRQSLDDIVERIRRKSNLVFPAPQVPEERLQEVGRIA